MLSATTTPRSRADSSTRCTKKGANYGDKNALVKLAARAADAGLIPTNYQALFSFTDSIRSPRSHGAGPKRDVEVVEIGQAEALLIGNHVRTLLLYLGNRPPIASKPAIGS